MVRIMTIEDYEIMELKNLYRGRIREYAEQYPGVKYVDNLRIHLF